MVTYRRRAGRLASEHGVHLRIKSWNITKKISNWSQFGQRKKIPQQSNPRNGGRDGRIWKEEYLSGMRRRGIEGLEGRTRDGFQRLGVKLGGARRGSMIPRGGGGWNVGGSEGLWSDPAVRLMMDGFDLPTDSLRTARLIRFFFFFFK